MSNYHAQQRQTLFLIQLIAQFKRSDLTTVSPVISGLTCVCLGALSLAFGFPYFSRGLACRNQRSIFLKISEVCEDELFWTGGDWTQREGTHGSPFISKRLALTLLTAHAANVSNGKGGEPSHPWPPGLVSASQLASQPDTSQAQLCQSKVLTGATAKSWGEWWAPFGETFSFSASVTADCCQWEDAVVGPLPGLVLVLNGSSLKNVGLGKRHSLCVRLD